MKKYRAVIYDLDGTLLNTLNMNMYPLMRIIEEEKGEKWNFQEVLKFAAYPGMKVMEELAIKDPENTYARWVKYVNEYEEGAILYEGIDEIMQCLSQHLIQAIVSAKTRKQYEIDFLSKGLGQYIQVAILAEDTQKHKPDPEPLLQCVKELQLDVNDVIYIGDALSDYLAAKNAGIDFGYAKWGSVSSQGIVHPTFILEKPNDLLKLIGEVK